MSLLQSHLQFTFHYASTLSEDFTAIAVYSSNLHSTMLLLYRFQPGERVLLHAPFTFHYASTLSYRKVRTTIGLYIYIPLCFYFIDHNGNTEVRVFNLHSTMLLLYLSGVRSFSRSALIYIPLCFYFIDGVVRQISSMYRFTFHYASTLSVPYDNLEYDIYIYIPLCFYFISCEFFDFVADIFIYIPLCFYFIVASLADAINGYDIYIPLCFYFILVHCFLIP